MQIFASKLIILIQFLCIGFYIFMCFWNSIWNKMTTKCEWNRLVSRYFCCCFGVSADCVDIVHVYVYMHIARILWPKRKQFKLVCIDCVPQVRWKTAMNVAWLSEIETTFRLGSLFFLWFHYAVCVCDITSNYLALFGVFLRVDD